MSKKKKHKKNSNANIPMLDTSLNASKSAVQMWLAQFIDKHSRGNCKWLSGTFDIDTFRALYNSNRNLYIRPASGGLFTNECCYFSMHCRENRRYVSIKDILSNADLAKIKERMEWRFGKKTSLETLSEDLDDAFILSKLIDFMHRSTAKDNECTFYVSVAWLELPLNLEELSKEVIQIELDLLDIEGK